MLVAASIGMVGCAPGPSPKPTPTPLFTSEADAFKAAEQVYRDYTDVGNAARDGDVNAKPDRYLAGTALEDEIATQRQLTEQRLKVLGPIRIVSFRGMTFDPASSRIAAMVCLDAANARVIDASGKDVTPAARKDQGVLDLVISRSRDHLVITESKSSDAECSSIAS